jgi:hypothetical protein
MMKGVLMQSARFRQRADAMIVTSSVAIGARTFFPGDFIVSDGFATWGVPHEVFVKHYSPASKTGKELIAQAAALRPKAPTQEEFEAPTTIDQTAAV